MRQSKKSKNEEKKVMKRKKPLKITKKLQNKSKKLRQKIDLHLANWGRTWKATINEKKKQTRKREKERASHVQFVVLVEFCGSQMNVNLRGIATVKSVDRLATCMDLFNYFFLSTMKHINHQLFVINCLESCLEDSYGSNPMSWPPGQFSPCDVRTWVYWPLWSGVKRRFPLNHLQTVYSM